MYAVINIPGSSFFETFGPAPRKECSEWLDAAKTYHQERYKGLWVNTYFPARIVSNKEAHSWRWRDGSRVIE